ncbi:MAG: T9SS type A sorting domain-containing protein [Bacteroidota bacterium]|nr:T9SS type A sorting domain-containing protein [Bacteroidota bacterium]
MPAITYLRWGLMLALAAMPALPVSAQLLDPGFNSPADIAAPGVVYLVGPAQTDGKRLVGGYFSNVNGTPVGRLVRLDAAGALDVAFSQNVGLNSSQAVRAKVLPGGQYLLGSSGGPLTVGSLTRTELLRLNVNGTPDASFNAGAGPGPGGYLRDFEAQPDGAVVAVGAFGLFSGQVAGGVVRLMPTGGVDPTFSVGSGIGTAAGDRSLAVAIQPDGKILVGGRFATFDGQPANGLVRLNANGSRDPTFVSPLNQSLARVEGLLLQPDGKVLAYGLLPVNSSTHPTPGIVRLLPSGSIDPSFSAPTFLDAQVSTGGVYGPAVVLQSDGKLVVAGSFVAPSANRLVRLNSNGTVDPSFQTGAGPSSAPTALGLQPNGTVWVGGFFNDYNGMETPLVQLASTGARDSSFNPSLQIDAYVQAMVRQPNGQVIIGGNFTVLGGQPVHRLARLMPNGMLDASFTAAAGVLPAAVTSLALQADGKVLAGSIAGTFRFGATGTPDPAFSAPYTTMRLALQADGRVLIGGQFSAFDGSTVHSRLMRLTPTGAIDPTFTRDETGIWTPNTTDALLVQPDGRIVVGGTWLPPGQALTTRVVRYLPTGALDPVFTNATVFTAASGLPSPDTRVYALAMPPDGSLLVGGNFGAVDGTLRYGVARLLSTGAYDPAYGPGPLRSGTVLALTVQPNGRVLVGGSMATIGPTGSLSGVLRLLEDGQLDGSFGPTTIPDNNVTAIALQPDGAILLAGSFTTVGSQPAVGVARIVAANVLHMAALTPLTIASAWPVPAHEVLHVAPESNAHPLSSELRDVSGRRVRFMALFSTAEFSFNVESLPAGVYFLQVNYIDKTAYRRIILE